MRGYLKGRKHKAPSRAEASSSMADESAPQVERDSKRHSDGDDAQRDEMAQEDCLPNPAGQGSPSPGHGSRGEDVAVDALSGSSNRIDDGFWFLRAIGKLALCF